MSSGTEDEAEARHRNALRHLAGLIDTDPEDGTATTA
jgi:hypothetical protein